MSRELPRRYRYPALSAVSLVCGVCVAAPPAGAQQAEAAANRGSLEEVVVTARKREESLQDTPISITALTSSDLETRGFVRLDDLNGAAPNVGWQSSPAGGTSTANFFIRGVGQFDFISTSDQSVGLYLDGVYLPRSIGAALDVVDVERIEILRGPQGTLFGRNTIGGAVQVITKLPGDDLEGSVAATWGSRDHADVKAHINVPLGEQAAARLSVASLNQDGYGRRLLNGLETGDVNNDAIHGQFRWRPTDAAEVLLSADASRRRGQTSPENLKSNDDANPFAGLYNALYLEPQGFPLINAANFVTGDPRTSWAGAPNRDDYDTRGASATVRWDANDAFEIKSITAWRSLESATAFDFDGTPYPFLDQTVDVEQRQWSQELQLSGKAFDTRLNWLVGAYYFREDVTENQLALLLAPIARTGGGLYDFAMTGLGLGYTTYLAQITDSYALYGQGTYQATDRLSFTAGLRYTLEEKELDSANTGGIVRGPVTVDDDWNAFTPKLGAEFKLDPNKLLYVSLAKGFRSGGFNGREAATLIPDSYEPEYIMAYEAGLKSDLLDRALRLNLSSYYYDYDDKQGTALKPNATVTVGNIGKVEMYGLELEATAIPMRGLQLSLGVGYGHHEIKEVDPSGSLTLRPDTKLENAPEWTGNAALSYTVDLVSAGVLSFYVDTRYKSAHEFLVPNYPGEGQGAYTVSNARVGLTSASGAWELQAFVQNLTDESYAVFTESTVGFGFPGVLATYGRPREWGLTAKYNF
jgi:iron complex outermembrane receptor protein